MNRQLSCPALTVQESTPRPCPSSNQAASTATSIPPCPTSRRCTPICPTTGATSSSSAACTSWNSIAYPANSPLTSRPDWRLPNGKPGSDLDALRAHALTPFGTSHRHLQLPLRRAAAVLRGHGRRLRPRGERLDGRRVAGQGAAAARLHRRADAERRTGGGGDQPRRRRPAASCRSCCW